jgi:hypothetical protein
MQALELWARGALSQSGSKFTSSSPLLRIDLLSFDACAGTASIVRPSVAN